MLFYFPPDSSKTLSIYVIDDTSILGEISMDLMKDVKSLTTPLDLKSESSAKLDSVCGVKLHGRTRKKYLILILKTMTTSMLFCVSHPKMILSAQ